MGKKMWIIYISITVAIFVIGSISMFMLIPQLESYSELPETYVGINRNEYRFDDSVNNQKLSKEYDITASDIKNGLKQDKYDEGNINPFTPKKDVNIYNEPTLNTDKNGSTLTPSDK